MPRNSKKSKTQKGGGSDFMGSFYANTAIGGPAAISQATLQGINNAPMFNPMSSTATIPGGSTGIVPSGIYLATHTGGGQSQESADLSKLTVPELRTLNNESGMSARDENGKYLKKSELVEQLQQVGGAFNGLYAMAPSSNQPTFH